jgi:small-conductance mechanosensitive channel/CRP-like cAMP-binding protein
MDQHLAGIVTHDLWSGELLGVSMAILLLLALVLLLPRDAHRALRPPVALLVVHGVLATTLRLLPGEGGLMHLLKVAEVFTLFAAIGGSAVLLVVDVLLSRRLVRPLPRIFRDLSQGLVYIGMGLIALHGAGIDPGSILTTSALLTAVIGLSLQDTLGNMVSGLAIQTQRPFDVGDWIQFDADPKHVGRVLEINWRATKVLTLDDVEITVPNGTLAKAPITNFTKPSPASRRSLYVQAPFEVAPERVHRAILAALPGSFGVAEDPAPSVVTNLFTDSGVEYWVRFWTSEFHRRDKVDGEARDRIWYALRRSHIAIAYPQRNLFLHEASAAASAREQVEYIAERGRALAAIDFLAVLPPPGIEALAQDSETRLYGNGEVVVRKGDHSNELFLVRRGGVRVLMPREGADDDEVARLAPGDFFGEMALMTGEPRTATVRADPDTELLVVGFRAFQRVLLANPEVAEHISRILVQRQAAQQAHARALTEAQAAEEMAEHTSHLLDRIRRFFTLHI